MVALYNECRIWPSRTPLIPAGKVEYDAIDVAGATPAALRSAIRLTLQEAPVVEAFRPVLLLGAEIERTPETDFSELCGHSLRQMQLPRVLSWRFDARLPLSEVIKRLTVYGLASLIEESKEGAQARRMQEQSCHVLKAHCR